ncbi:hypothetical protein GBAR_LOCUS9261, partial [Geodia barretti]
DIHVLPAYTYTGREVQKEVVTIHANALHNRLRQKEVKKSDCHRDQNGYHQFPQTALPCKTYRGARQRTYTLSCLQIPFSGSIHECPINALECTL